MPEQWGMWAYLGYVTQVVAVPTPIGIKIAVPTDDELRVCSASILAGTFGGARAVVLNHLDGADNTLHLLMAASLTTGQVIYGPSARHHASTATADTVSAIGAPFMPHPVVGDDYIKLEGASLANTEVLTLRLRGLVRRGLPTLSTIGAGIPRTDTYSKVL